MLVTTLLTFHIMTMQTCHLHQKSTQHHLHVGKFNQCTIQGDLRWHRQENCSICISDITKIYPRYAVTFMYVKIILQIICKPRHSMCRQNEPKVWTSRGLPSSSFDSYGMLPYILQQIISCVLRIYSYASTAILIAFISQIQICIYSNQS